MEILIHSFCTSKAFISKLTKLSVLMLRPRKISLCGLKIRNAVRSWSELIVSIFSVIAFNVEAITIIMITDDCPRS